MSFNSKTIDIHVDYQNGNDTTGDGSELTPYKTYAKAVTQATAGDVIGLGNNADHVLAAAVDWSTVGGAATLANPILTTTWNSVGTAGLRAVVSCNNGGYGIWTNAISYLVLDYVEIKNCSASFAITLGSAVYDCIIARCIADTGVVGFIQSQGGRNRIIGNFTSTSSTDTSVYLDGFYSLFAYNVCKFTGAYTTRAVYVVGYGHVVVGNVMYSSVAASGLAIEFYTDLADFNCIIHNTIIGTSDNGNAIEIQSGALGAVIVANIIQDHSVGIEWNSQTAGYVALNNIYSCTTTDQNRAASWVPDVEHTLLNPDFTNIANSDYSTQTDELIGQLWDLHYNYGADQYNAAAEAGTAGGGGDCDCPTAAEIADAVLEELVASHSGVAGSLAERLSRIPNIAAGSNGGLPTIGGTIPNAAAGANGGLPTIGGKIPNATPGTAGGLPTVNANNYVAGIQGTVVNTLDKLAGASFVEGTHALDQTATLSQLNAEVDTALSDIGLDHLLSAAVGIADVANNSVVAKLASKNSVAIWSTFANTTDSLQAIADGATSSVIADAVWDELLSGHTTSGSTGERIGRLPNANAGAGGGLPTVNASNYVAGIQGTICNTLDALAGTTYVKASHALDTVGTQVAAKLADINLDHLLKVSCVSADVASGSVVSKLASSTADWGTYSYVTDSLQAISDAGGGGGGGGVSAAEVWAYGTRTLTQTAGEVASAMSAAGNITIQRGDTLTLSFSGLGSLANREELVFTVKASSGDPEDSAAKIQILEFLGTVAGTAGTNGLLYINGNIADTPANGEITVTDATAGDLTITLAPVETAKLPTGSGYVYDLQMCTLDGAVHTLADGRVTINEDVTKRLCD